MVLENLVTSIGKAKLADFVSNPKGSRQFQQYIKLGSKEHRNDAIEAICKQVPDLAVRNIYALITLEKIVTYGIKTDETFTVEKMLKPVMTDRKTVEQLLFHRLGCKFLNKLYMHPSIKPALKKQMLQIILVPRSIELLGESTPKLRQYYLETAKKCIDKELLGYELVQRLLKQAVVDFADDATFNEELLAMASDGLPHLLSSREGVHVAVKLLGIASAKQKKNIIKELKGKFAEMAKNSVTCVALLRLLQCVDDTVLVGKSVLTELVGSDYAVGKDLLLDPTGRTAFLFVLESLQMKSMRLYYQPDKQLLDATPITSSLKERDVKAAELIAKLAPSVSKIVKSEMTEVLHNDTAKDVVVALMRTVDDAERSEIVNAMSHALIEGEMSQSVVSAVNSVLKEFSAIAARPVWAALVELLSRSDDAVVTLMTGLGSFIIMNLLKAEDQTVVESVRGFLLKWAEDIKSIAAGVKGTEIVKTELAAMKTGTNWDETKESFKLSAKRVRETIAEKPVEVKKQKTAQPKQTNAEGENQEELFGDDEELDDEMWGIVGDDDEFFDDAE